MRLLIASGIAAPEIGGPATFIACVVPHLVSRGYDIRVLAYGDGGSDDLVQRIPRGPLAVRLPAYARAYWRAALRADAVLVLGLLLPRWTPRGVPVALKVPGDYVWERSLARGWIAPDEDLEGFEARRHGWRVQVLKRWRRAEVTRADRVIVPSEFLDGIARSWGVAPERLVLIPNAAPARARLESRGEARAALGWEPTARVLLTAGRLVAWKHVDLVIQALVGTTGVRLVVAGDGPERGRLEALAGSRGIPAEFVGTLSHDALGRLMRASDYLVLYSSYEGLSHTLLEALRAGTPVIASRRGGNPEVVRHGVNGLLVDHPDVGALRAAFGDALTLGRPERLASGTSAGLERFDDTRVAASLVAVFDELLGGRPRRSPRPRA